MVTVENLVKNYKKVEAVKNISFSVNKGEIFGLIGPDGAGKTSIFRMLASLIIPDSGKITLNDFDPVNQYENVRECIGYMPGKFSLYQDLSVEENLSFFASMFSTTIEANYDLIKDIYVQIEPFKDRRAGALSGGMKQKLALCCALIHKPVVLLLDEPTTGVDPVSRKEFWHMLKKLKEKDITIIVSTPYMDEAESCDRVALVQDGEILKIDSPESIANDYENKLLWIKAKDMFKLLNTLRSIPEVISAYSFGEHVHVTIAKDKQLSEALINELSDIEGLEILPGKPTIEDSFMALGKEESNGK
ncbi:ABC transporter ATP-binding protein [Aureibacter tunicatorum]|uniref:ABC-type multidrug transport system ATPase subunit n=1 Tax=Aureibacter tunicatorum TaxID=866807 RepID=A0AAE3XIM5_9BACT|nr:ABC transporter ATP-binding protein [Aureibacter tunicatorum]MDR6237512.1 ABC-type multidrug transport system ATPase subunit [Aureibacter tunicatorum]